MVVLKNENMRVSIDEMGAEIKSIIKNGTEYMWSADPAFWNKTAPILFPICGRLKDNKYIFEGKEYSMNAHGFASKEKFSVESFDETSATFLLCDTSKTRQIYPFNFEFRVTYTLNENSLIIDFEVKNNSGKTMYFSVGSHEGFATPEGIEEYDIIFEQEENLATNDHIEGRLCYTSTPIMSNTKVLPLDDKYFAIDALIFTDIKSRQVTLKNRKSGRFVTVDFPDCPYLLIWHKVCAPYICIEPWNGIPDFVDSDYNFAEKKGITALKKDKIFKCSHKITLGEKK